MPKTIKGLAGKKPPEPSPDHADLDAWFGQVIPNVQPIVRGLDEVIRAAIPGLQYAVKRGRAYYGLPDLGWLHRDRAVLQVREHRLLRRRRLRAPAAARRHRPDALREADQRGRAGSTRRPRLDQASQPNPRVELTLARLGEGPTAPAGLAGTARVW